MQETTRPQDCRKKPRYNRAANRARRHTQETEKCLCSAVSLPFKHRVPGSPRRRSVLRSPRFRALRVILSSLYLQTPHAYLSSASWNCLYPSENTGTLGDDLQPCQTTLTSRLAHYRHERKKAHAPCTSATTILKAPPRNQTEALRAGDELTSRTGQHMKRHNHTRH